MTRPSDPSRPAAPTVREIAELTARLRDISNRGRDVDPAERARFLADKDALIGRITDADITADADGGRAVEIGDALTAGRGGPVMPEWMREQARDTGAAVAAGTAPSVQADDALALADRLPELRTPHGGDSVQIVDPGSGPPSTPDRGGSSSPAEDERREQLARWHADDQTAGHDDGMTHSTCGGDYRDLGRGGT